MCPVPCLATPHVAGYSEQGKATATAMSVATLAGFFGLPLRGWYPSEAAPSVRVASGGVVSAGYSTGAQASLAQLVEHLICNHEVIGSTPIAGSIQKR